MTQKPILVQKFGGTSVSTPERRQQAMDHVRRARDDGYRVVLVVSAMGRRGDPYATDTLLDLLRGDGGPVDKRDYDMIFVCGEIISATLMAHLLKRQGIPAVGLSGAQAGVVTDDNHSEAEVVEVDPTRLHTHLERGEVPVVAGSQGIVGNSGDYATLGRGGSDTSGVALGVALGAAKVEIYTDVEGVARANPKLVPGARLLQRIRYGSMLEMARYGAAVVHPRAVRTGRDGGVPVVVRSTFSSHPGTLIGDVEDECPVVGIATMGPLEALVVARDAVDVETREEWERRRLIMSLVDPRHGVLVLAVSSEKSHELAWARRELGLTREASASDTAWVSLVGEAAVLQARSREGLDLLVDRGVEIMYHELAGRRTTYVVPADQEARAVQLLYERLMGE